jgi:hypothetical protein
VEVAGLSPIEWATIAALAVNLVTLLVVGYQTYLTRKAVEATNESLALAKGSMQATKESTQLAIRTIQIEMLPKAGWVISVQVELKGWLEDLKKTASTSQLALERRDDEAMRVLARHGLETPAGLVRRSSIERMPDWLSTILFAGAQYYYDAKAPQTGLWHKRDDSAWYDFVPDFVRRCEDSISGLHQLLGMIDDIVPEAYLHSPARLNDDRFMD